MVGKNYNVIVEKVDVIDDKKCFIASTDAGKDVIIFADTTNNLKIGEFYNAKITKLYRTKLVGEII